MQRTHAIRLATHQTMVSESDFANKLDSVCPRYNGNKRHHNGQELEPTTISTRSKTVMQLIKKGRKSAISYFSIEREIENVNSIKIACLLYAALSSFRTSPNISIPVCTDRVTVKFVRKLGVLVHVLVVRTPSGERSYTRRSNGIRVQLYRENVDYVKQV